MATPVQIQPKIQTEAFVEGALVDTAGIERHHYQTWLACWLAELAPALSPINAYEISLRLTTDAEIKQLNTDYRHQTKPTDVLSFAALETDLPGAEAINQEQPLYLGDIIISVETAQRQANEYQRTLQQEIAWLAAHGLLHLLGWDHPDEQSLINMLERQDQLLSLIDHQPNELESQPVELPDNRID